MCREFQRNFTLSKLYCSVLESGRSLGEGRKVPHSNVASIFLLRKYTSKASVKQELLTHLTAVVSFLWHLRANGPVRVFSNQRVSELGLEVPSPKAYARTLRMGTPELTLSRGFQTEVR